MASENPDGIFQPSFRIKQLNDIDKDVVGLLELAGLAVQSLTKSTPLNDISAGQIISVEQTKESFTTATSNYFTLLSSLDVRLRRQIYALKEADILPSETSSANVSALMPAPPGVLDARNGMNAPLPKPTGKGNITGGGLGSFDVGWLNSRQDHVGRKKEADLWEDARNFVQSAEQRDGILKQVPAVQNED